jgi:hypothetical protein
MALPPLELPPIEKGSPCCRAALLLVEKVGRNCKEPHAEYAKEAKFREGDNGHHEC